MRVAQKLYEAGYITYMRTDAPSLSKESIQDARNFITDNMGEKYLTNAPRIYSSTENAQEAHEAIRPTNAFLKASDLQKVSEEEVRLYGLIWQQYIASQMPNAEYLSTTAKIELKEYTFSAKGREVVFDGYTKVANVDVKDSDTKILPILNEGDVLGIDKVNLDQKFTKPPARFSEAALVKELEKRELEDLQHMHQLFLLSKIEVMLRLKIEDFLSRRLAILWHKDSWIASQISWIMILQLHLKIL